MQPSPINLVIAEDHTLVRQAIIGIINQFPNCKVVADTDNGQELILLLAGMPTPPDVCILDINMPVLNGYDTLIQLRKLYPAMKFLVLTMFDSEYSIISMIKNGANGYILKGCDIDELHNAIISIYNYGYYYSSAATEDAFSLVKKTVLPHLTEKELLFLSLNCRLIKYVDIAALMYVSVRTVEDYQKNISKKLHIHSRAGLALFAVYTGIVPMSKPELEKQ